MGSVDGLSFSALLVALFGSLLFLRSWFRKCFRALGDRGVADRHGAVLRSVWLFPRSAQVLGHAARPGIRRRYRPGGATPCRPQSATLQLWTPSRHLEPQTR